ncbi:MAG: glycosyltransferase family 2 protein [Desulfobacterales bacterium]|nr:glycosyltransferase family 2 protein [Desulfobacterales bacterium]
MIDILLTTRNRLKFLKQTMGGVANHTHLPYRLFIIDDCSDDGTRDYLMSVNPGPGLVVLLNQRMGVVYGFNALWNMAEYFDDFVDHYPYMCYLQDDAVPVENDWLPTLIRAYEELKDKHNLGFFSGYDAPEHPHREDFEWEGRKVCLKDSISFQNAVAEKAFWQSIGKVPRLNPDGKPRGYPADGVGSQIDVYMTGCCSKSRFVPGASAVNSSFNQGKKVLVIPGLIDHIGQAPQDSTWRGDR